MSFRRRIGAASAVLLASGLSSIGVGASNWTAAVATGSKGEGAARAAITTLTGNPSTFTAACGTGESATLTWTTAGTGVTGYQVMVSATVNGTYAAATTQPSGTALTVTETYTSSTTGDKYFRLEAKSTNWAFPGATVTDAREATVGATTPGFLVMSSTSPNCRAN